MALILITVMDKYFFALIFFANYQFYAYSQKEMVKIEGFLIERYSKKEIFRKDTLSIDHSMDTFYFTTQIDSIRIMSPKEIYSALVSPCYKNVEIYKFSPFDREYGNYIAPNICPVPLKKQNLFYTLCSDSVFVYKVYSVKGQAIRLCIANDYLNSKKNMELAVKWNISPTSIDKRIPFFYIYVFFDVINNSINTGIPVFFKPIVCCGLGIQGNTKGSP